MKRLLRYTAALLVPTSVIIWLATGASRGWTKTSFPVKAVDEVTGIEGISYQPRFVPGLDFLGSALAGACVLAVASLAFKNTTNEKQTYSSKLETL